MSNKLGDAILQCSATCKPDHPAITYCPTSSSLEGLLQIAVKTEDKDEWRQRQGKVEEGAGFVPKGFIKSRNLA